MCRTGGEEEEVEEERAPDLSQLLCIEVEELAGVEVLLAFLSTWSTH